MAGENVYTSSSHNDPDDDELIAAARAGDRTAINTLLALHYDRIYAICWRLTRNDADAADGCQEALIAITRALPRFDGRAKFSTWSYRIATNACIDELRRRKRRPTPTIDHPEVVSDGQQFDDQLADRFSLDEALQQLTDDFRLPIMLRDIGGLDYASIAEKLEIPPGTVRSRIARGRRQLCDILGNFEGRQSVQEPEQWKPSP